VRSATQADGSRAARLRTVVLVGGGHAHVQVLARWAMAPPQGVRTVVVVDRPIAVYSGMVPGLVAGDYRQEELEIDVLRLARRAGASVILSAATDLDPVRREIALEGRAPIRYDLASLDVGSTVRALALPGVAEHTLSTRPIGRFVESVEARIDALIRSGRRARIVVVGGGAAGCELAFTLDARLRRAGLAPQVTLVTSDAAPLAGAAPALQRRLADLFAARGLAIRSDTRIARAAPGRVIPEKGEPIEGDLIVWATGAAPVAFPANAALARDRDGFLLVRDTLELVGVDAVFAVGDCARLVDHPWVPRAGVYAVRQGPVLERNLRAALAGGRLETYSPQRDFLALLNLGDGRALASKWGFAWAGRSAFRLKDRIDRAFMARFQARDDATIDAMADGMTCGGCAAKLAAEPLAAALARLAPAPADASVLVGVAERDDVAVTRGSDGRTTLHNIDAIRAFADDPWLVGRVAAANATSDLYAKGGRPRHAQALIGLPEASPEAAEEMLFQVLGGLRATLDALGVSLVGGHTLTSEVLSVGLAVTGEGPEDGPLLRQSGARPGDGLWLTRPLGTGVVLAADLRGLAHGPWVAAAHASMLRTHAVGSRLALAAGARAATDVTGFGLAGHLSSLLRPAGLGARLDRSAVPLLPGARALFQRGLRSTAHAGNRAAFHAAVEGASPLDEGWLHDPQTSGGLLLAVPPDAGARLAEAFAAAGEPPIARVGELFETRDGRVRIVIEGAFPGPVAPNGPATKTPRR
jgi:selenide,water dikinase